LGFFVGFSFIAPLPPEDPYLNVLPNHTIAGENVTSSSTTISSINQDGKEISCAVIVYRFSTVTPREILLGDIAQAAKEAETRLLEKDYSWAALVKN